MRSLIRISRTLDSPEMGKRVSTLTEGANCAPSRTITLTEIRINPNHDLYRFIHIVDSQTLLPDVRVLTELLESSLQPNRHSFDKYPRQSKSSYTVVAAFTSVSGRLNACAICVARYLSIVHRLGQRMYRTGAREAGPLEAIASRHLQ